MRNSIRFLVAMIAICAWVTSAQAQTYDVTLTCEDGRVQTWKSQKCDMRTDIGVRPYDNCGDPRIVVKNSAYSRAFRHMAIWSDGSIVFECQEGFGPSLREQKVDSKQRIGDWSIGAGTHFTGIRDHETFVGGEAVFEGNLYTGVSWLNIHFEFRTGGDKSFDSDQSGWTIAEVVGLQFRMSDTVKLNLGAMHRLSLTQESENYNAVMALVGLGLHLGGGINLVFEGSVGNAWHQAGSSYSLLDGVRVNPAHVPAFAQDRLTEESELLNTHSLAWGAGLRLIYNHK